MMRFFTWIPVSTLALFSAVEPVLPPVPQGWIQGGALGVLALTLWCVFMRVLPAHDRAMARHDEAMAAQRDAFLAKLKQDND